MNKPSLLSLLLVGIVVLGMSCKSQKIGANKLSNSQDFYLSMAKTPCFGKCPIYVITLDASGALTLNAKRFMSLEGQFISLLDIVQLDSISLNLKKLSGRI